MKPRTLVAALLLGACAAFFAPGVAAPARGASAAARRAAHEPLQHPAARAAATAAVAAALALNVLGAAPPPALAVYNKIADVGIGKYMVKDASEWARLSLPTSPDVPPAVAAEAVKLQEGVELPLLIYQQVGAAGRAPVWQAISRDVGNTEALLDANAEAFYKYASNPSKARKIAEKDIRPALVKLEAAIRSENIDGLLSAQKDAGEAVGDLRELLAPTSATPPYTIPAEFDALPRLYGRPLVEVEIKKGGSGKFSFDDGRKVPSAYLYLSLDGYHQPLTVGNFVDLAKKGFYDGLPVYDSEELTVFSGLPKDGSGGYAPTKGGPLRTLPLELHYRYDKEPSYDITSDESGRFKDAMATPFQAYGAIGMERSGDSTDNASSSFFLLKWDRVLVPPGRNTFDGYYSCFGYAVNEEAPAVIKQMEKGDTIVSVNVLSGAGKLVQGK